MMVRIGLVLGLLALVPLEGIAQEPREGQDCELLPGAREAVRRVVGGEEFIYVAGPARFVCPGDVVLEADSAVGNQVRGEVELIGGVFFQDSVKTLTAEWANYLRDEGRLIARDDVVLTDRESGSTIRGKELEHYPVTETRPESETIIRGRPHATLYRGTRSERDDDEPVTPIEVDADLMQIFAETRFLAMGRVEILHDESKGYADRAEFSDEVEELTLIGNASLEGEGYDLSGERIRALIADEVIDEVIASGEAALIAEDLDLESHELRIFFQDGELNRLIAVGPRMTDADELPLDEEEEPTLGAPEHHADQPIVISTEFTLAADSIEIIAPGRELELVIAVGRASGVRAPDTLDLGLPDDLAQDWLVGDTILGYFKRELVRAEADDGRAISGADADALHMTASDDGEEKVVLDRLIAVGPGGAARSLYRIYEDEGARDRPSINYLIAERITLVMKGGEVGDVEADGPIEGIHLQPDTPPSREAEQERDDQSTTMTESGARARDRS